MGSRKVCPACRMELPLQVMVCAHQDLLRRKEAARKALEGYFQRTGRLRGEQAWNCKLLDAERLEIRRVYAEGKTTQLALAQRYGVHERTIRRVLKDATAEGITHRHSIARARSTTALLTANRRWRAEQAA